MKMAYLTMIAGLCAIASCAWGGVRLQKGWGGEHETPGAVCNRKDEQERSDGARVQCSRRSDARVILVEILDFPRAAVTIRDHDGSILYRISPTERLTVVAKRVPQKPVVTPGRMSAPQESGSPETASTTESQT